MSKIYSTFVCRNNHVYQKIIRAAGHALQFFIRKFCRGG